MSGSDLSAMSNERLIAKMIKMITGQWCRLRK